MRRLLASLFLPVLLQTAIAQEEDEPAKKSAPQKAEPAKNSRALFTVEKLAAKVRRSAVVITHGGRSGGEGGTGSGFVVSKDGLIATCAHVIGESRPLTVRFDDGTESTR